MTEINEYQKAWAISKEELNLRWKYANTNMTLDEFDKYFEKLKQQGKIKKDGRVIK